VLETAFAPCAVDGCVNESQRAGRCWAHHKRKCRGAVVDGSLAPRHQVPFDAVTEAALAYAEAEEDEDFERAREQLRRAAVRYVQSLPSSQRPARVTRARRRRVDERQLSLFAAPELSEPVGAGRSRGAKVPRVLHRR
jgi:hypothetical protein